MSTPEKEEAENNTSYENNVLEVEEDNADGIDTLCSFIFQSDDLNGVGNPKGDEEHPAACHRKHEGTIAPRASIVMPRSSGGTWPESSKEPRPLVANVVANEVATFFDVFGWLGIPMIVVFLLSAAWTFMLAAIQVNADEMANNIMNTTEFDNGNFWLLPKPGSALVISSALLLSLFGSGYTGLAVLMIFFYRTGSTRGDEANVDARAISHSSGHESNTGSEGREGNVVYVASCVRMSSSPLSFWHSFDLFFAVYAPLVVLVYVIYSFQFDRAAFLTKTETLSPGTFDTVARLFGDPSEISSFCNAFHYLQFSSGTALFYKSALNLLSLYKWRKIVMTLIHNHHKRQQERKRKLLVGPVPRSASREGSFKSSITKRLTASKLKFEKHFVPKLFLALVFFLAGIGNFVYSIGSVESTVNLCSKYSKCVVRSYHWNFGKSHCTCLVFADRQTGPNSYADWTDPEDTTQNLAELATAGGCIGKAGTCRNEVIVASTSIPIHFNYAIPLDML
ncbi:unnamed protein product [Phytophthora lilii]|uniref:Unnamed protein product n=1 Tax=Phytophthora lilii TaxID=2077276 RepID=A0A9W6WLZ9_9STRA|nr:unnamed protein product [Phytophthora lilii]